MSGDGRLPDPLAQPDHGERRRSDRMQGGRVEAEVGADIRKPESQGTRSPEEPLARAEHRLVREVDDRVCLHGVERVDERHAVVLSAGDLLRAADEQRAGDLVRQGGERVPHDRRMVLAVDQHERPHVARTSSSMRAVYFSYVFVSVENWMIRSCP